MLVITDLPAQALDAARHFHEHWADQASALLDGGNDLLIVVPPAEYDHADWRRSVVRDLARQYAPLRVNMVAGEEGPRLEETIDYLARAPGLTGQYLPLHQD